MKITKVCVEYIKGWVPLFWRNVFKPSFHIEFLRIFLKVFFGHRLNIMQIGWPRYLINNMIRDWQKSTGVLHILRRHGFPKIHNRHESPWISVNYGLNSIGYTVMIVYTIFAVAIHSESKMCVRKSIWPI